MPFALQSPQEGLRTPMLPMVLAEGTMMPSEAREVILGNLETGENGLPKYSCSLSGVSSHHPILPLSYLKGWSVETHGPLWNTVTWMLQTTWISFEPSFPHSWYHLQI